MQKASFMDEPLKKRREIYKNIKRRYFHKTRKTREFLEFAKKISSEELRDNIHAFTKSPSIKEAIFTLKDLVGSSTWVSVAYMKHIMTVIKFLQSSESLPLPKQDFIVNQVANKNEISPQYASTADIFEAIYNDLIRENDELEYKSRLKLVPHKITIVLVSGVFNELFKTAAFEKGCEQICKELKAKYFVAKVGGAKGVKHNAALIKNQLENYIEKHPTEKLWIVAFSKGGIDSLHYLRHNGDFANKHIHGISTIASPIIGSSRADQKILLAIRSLQKLTKNYIFTRDKLERDLFAIKLQESVSSKVQGKWFKNNYKELPKKLFYTALGLRASWHESHLGMIATKIILPTKEANDGIVDIYQSQFPDYFKAYNLGIIQGHHLIGYRLSSYNQDILLKAHIIFLQYVGRL
ncbi:MAG: hypothetical protein A2577_02055 [Bdellovibrionales bacterium RIFOXYD1_FULL_36_51]|nr:MAG: hypothetical protein A2577_02055 [Bdellovibrionales bacterium RIFOXYD1_FULL_36_51]